LYLRRLELSRAMGEFQEAYVMDSSPLSKLSLAKVFLAGGRLAEARLYAEDCLKAADHSWMINYGIDPVRYRRDIHEVLSQSYEGLYRAEAFFAPADFKESVQSFFRAVSYRFRAAVHRHLFHKHSLLAANAYPAEPRTEAYGVTGGLHPAALLQYSNAFDRYPRRALAYLRQARKFEEPLIPGSLPSYDFEEGRLLGNRDLLSTLPGAFDPLWERDMIAKVYAELAMKGKKAERQDAAERLFALNRGALLQNGIRLPLELKINAASGRVERALKRALKDAGMEQAVGARYTLTIDSSVELYDGVRGIIVFRQNLPLTIKTGSERAVFVRALRDGIFSAF